MYYIPTMMMHVLTPTLPLCNVLFADGYPQQLKHGVKHSV